MKTEKKTELIVEILAEGGGLDIFRTWVKNEKGKPVFAYHSSTVEMGLEDDEKGMISTGESRITSIENFFESLLKKYHNLFELGVGYIHPDCKQRIANFMMIKIAEAKLDVSRMYGLDTWLEHLNLRREVLPEPADIYEQKTGNFNQFFGGYCPECLMNGKMTDMKLNTSDLWECPEDHLQIATNRVYAVVLWRRGQGIFREPVRYASDTLNGDTVLVESAGAHIEPTSHLFDSYDEWRQYLSEKVEPLKKETK